MSNEIYSPHQTYEENSEEVQDKHNWCECVGVTEMLEKAGKLKINKTITSPMNRSIKIGILRDFYFQL